MPNANATATATTTPAPQPDSAPRLAPPASVEAALLMGDGAEVRLRALRETLNDILAPSELHFEERACRHGLCLSAGSVHLMISGSDSPLPEARLAPALRSELGPLVGEDWQALADRHCAALLLCAGVGPEPAEDPATEPVSQASHDLMLTVVHVAATFLAAELDPLAVLWDGSEQLFAGNRFLEMADMLFPLPLFIHPRPILTDRSDGEMQATGLDLIGAEALIGTRLTLRPAPCRVDWLIERALAFVAHARATGAPLPPGDSFGLAEGERIAVEMAPDGGLALVVKERDGVFLLQPDAPARPHAA